MSSRRTMMDGTRVSSMESPGSSRETMWTRSQLPNCVDKIIMYETIIIDTRLSHLLIVYKLGCGAHDLNNLWVC